ncbi:GrpB family protein [Pseudonocardia sp. ICBG1293]|uniref:GrpB family protein n=1 Tax=Pseudonocardia sp. ICBG1293 TaxID=2844382 RepID=UPI001CCF6E48|nr:GrpB family protein [Pseudonocardia sp. ICBG1293]
MLATVTSREEQLSRALVHGMRPVLVELAEPDPEWPAAFDAAAARLRAVLGERAHRIEHIGSTSVPGLAAKPVIDVVVALEDPDDEPAYLAALLAEGYDLRVREPGHRCLRGAVGDLAVNLHCYPDGSPEITRYLVFRDRLRTCAEDRERYEAHKRGLAGRVWPDMNLYADAKGPVIEEIIARG